MNKIWKIKNSNPNVQSDLIKSAKIHPIISHLLVNRGLNDINEAKRFLSADLSDLDDPFLLKGMDAAVKRIKDAQRDKEKVLIFGDYDVDGVTSSAILNSTLTKLGLEVINHIPHRVHDGYGLNHEIGEYAKEEGITLLIAVDCGIMAKDEVNTFNNLGIDTIILDHHEPATGMLPNAVAIVNPKQKDCNYPFKEFAAVGLVAKLTQALNGKIEDEVLDLTAVGTIADVVPLRGENRIFVKHGLKNINKTNNKGLSALLDIAKIKDKKLNPFHVGFILGPRINASGRMDSAHKSLDLFLAKDKDVAKKLAKQLDKHNLERQKMQRNIVDEALQIVEQQVNFNEHKVIVLNKEGWHKGVLGIVASRITDKYYRPAIVISTEDGIGTASARSIDGFHLHDALSECSNCLEEFGGHEGAAGLTIKQENIDPFRDLINKVADNILEIKKLIPSISIDCEIALSSINLELANIIDSLQPFGEGNPEPVFCTRSLRVKGMPRLLGRETIKFWVTDGDYSIPAIGFGMSDFKDMVSSGEKIDIAYQIIIDDWNKSPTPLLKLKDIRISE